MCDERARPRYKSHGTKKIRIDSLSSGRNAPESRSRGLLALFRAWIDATPAERRVVPRYETGSFHVWLGWWKRPEEFLVTRARMANVSRYGALVFLHDPPPETFPVWIYRGESEPHECIQAIVLDVRSTKHKECSIRLRFCKPCSHQFFQAAIGSIDRARSRNNRV